MELIGNINENKELRHKKTIRNNIAWELLDGPRAIFPLSKIDDFGWLEPVLTIKNYRVGIGKVSVSCSIYVDNTVNRHKKFITPIVRYSIWDRPKELNAKRFKKWPEVKIVQHELSKTEQVELDALLRVLDIKISALQFAVGGLITDRGDPAPVDYSIGFRNMSFSRWNGCQTIDFSFGDTNNQNIELEQTINDIMIYIIDVCKMPMRKFYRERYNTNLKEIYEFFDKIESWDFRPPHNAK